MKLLLYKVLMVIIIVGNPDSSNEIYISIEKDIYGGDQVLAINGHDHINKRHANSAATSSKRIRLSKDLDLKVYIVLGLGSLLILIICLNKCCFCR